MNTQEHILDLYSKGYSEEGIAELTEKPEISINAFLSDYFKKYSMDKHSRLTRYARHKGYESIGDLYAKEGYHATHDFHKEFLNKIK